MKNLFCNSLLTMCLVGLLGVSVLTSCDNKKTSGFTSKDVLGRWSDLTIGVAEPFSLNEDGTGVYEGFISNLEIKWDLRQDSLFMSLYREGYLYKQNNYSIDSINIEVHDGNRFRVLYLSRMERVHQGYSYYHFDDESFLNFRKWLKTSEGLQWLGERRYKTGTKFYGSKYNGEYSNDWLWSEQGIEWLDSEDGKAWQQTADGKEFMRTELRQYSYAQQVK